MATLSDVECDIRTAYDSYRSDWYGDSAPPSATFKVEMADFTSGYSPSEDTLTIYVGAGDVEDWEFKRNNAEAPWRIELIHEMLHEHQHKVVKTPSAAGKALFAKRPNAFDGQGHDERFYTAIADIAPKFGKTPEEFLDFI